MNRFDSGGSAKTSEIIFASAMAVLSFPIVLITEGLIHLRFFSSLAGYTPFILNSLLWGMGLYYFGMWVKKSTEIDGAKLKLAR